MRHLVFDRLPTTVSRRLTRSLADGGLPRPLFSALHGPKPPSARKWTYIAVGAAIVDCATWVYGFVDRLNEPGLSPLQLALIHAVAISVVIFAAIRSLRIRKQYQGISYPPGRHLFELDLVEVSGKDIRLFPLHTLKGIEARVGSTPPAIALVFSDGREVLFDVQADAEAEVKSAQLAIETALSQDLERLEPIDPFFELRIGNEWAAAEATKDSTQAASKKSFIELMPSWGVVVLAAVVGLIAGGFALRAGEDHLRTVDDARFAAARGNGDLLERYIAKGGKHVAKAQDALFDARKDDPSYLAKVQERGGPRADLAAKLLFDLQLRKGDEFGLAQQIKDNTKYAAEADDALFQIAKQRGHAAGFERYLENGKRHVTEVEGTLLPEALLAEALKKGTIEPLRGLIKRVPNSPQAKTAAQKMYAIALEYYVNRQVPPSAAQRFMEAMLTSIVERNDPVVVLDVTVPPGTSLGSGAGVLSGVERGVYGVLEWWLQDVFPKGFLQVVKASANQVKERPLFKMVVAPQITGELVTENGRAFFDNVQFRLMLRATLPGRSEQITWSATTVGLKKFTVTYEYNPYDQDKSRKNLGNEVYRRLMDQIDPVLHAQMDKNL